MIAAIKSKKAAKTRRKQVKWINMCHSFADAVGDQMLVIDENHQVLMANKAFLESNGLSENEVLGRHCYEISHHVFKPCQPPNDQCPLGQVVSSGEASTVTHVHFDSQNRRHFVEIVASPVRNHDGHLVAVVESIRDITHQKELEENLRQRNAELEDARQKREDFTSTVCHELKNIVNILKLNAQLLQKGISPELSQKHSGVIVAQSDRLNRLIDDMRDAVAIETQRFSLSRNPCDIVAIVRQSAEAHQLSTRKHLIVVDAPKNPLIGMWDSGRLRQVVDNLLSNAIKYSPNGGLVHVKVACDNEQVVVSVTDQGVGIPADYIPHLFQPYARSHKEISGVGLGLFVSRGMIEAHGGRVWVVSQENEGSTFAFSLPLQSPEERFSEPEA